MGYLGGLSPRQGLGLCEDLHHIRVQLRHEDLDGLVRLDVDAAGQEAIQRVEGVQVPTVTSLRK